VKTEYAIFDILKFQHYAEAWMNKRNHIEVETRINFSFCFSPLNLGAMLEFVIHEQPEAYTFFYADN